MAETKAVAKVKKRWFTVLSPDVFGQKELADIPAISAESVVKRLVDITGQMLTGLPRDLNKKYKLQIVEAVGDKLRTESQSYYLAESFVQRTAKRYKDRFLFVVKGATKDNKIATVKLYFLNLKKLHHSERGAILAKTKEFLANEVKETEAPKLFDPNIIDKITTDLRKALSEIYTVDKILLTKLLVTG
jgi:small subunit ribosomal protein S3Ae